MVRPPAKLRRKPNCVFPLSDLPDGVLSTIASLLPLKEAARTSILSKRWRQMWTCHPDLLLDSETMLGSAADSDDKRLFRKRVNKFMAQRSQGGKIDSFTVRFHLGKESASDIDGWLRVAAMKGAEFVDLDFSEGCNFQMNNPGTKLGRYEIPSGILAPGKKSCLKHLRLVSCNLALPPPRSTPFKLDSLISIDLQEVNINDLALENLLHSCSNLENLSLGLCKDLIDLKISLPDLKLRSLIVKNCFRLQGLDISALKLKKFEYVGHRTRFCFRNVPKLTDVFLNLTGDRSFNGLEYAITKLLADVPQVETLNLVSVSPMKMANLSNELIFNNIKRLVLTVFPFDDEDDLHWMSYILKAFPELQSLELNLFSPTFLKKPDPTERVVPDCCHKHLNQVEINGFYGNQHEADLLMFLLDSSAELKKLIVSPSQKVHRGIDDWEREEPAGSWYKSRLETITQWLRASVPATVDLILQ